MPEESRRPCHGCGVPISWDSRLTRIVDADEAARLSILNGTANYGFHIADGAIDGVLVLACQSCLSCALEHAGDEGFRVMDYLTRDLRARKGG